jgi:hypothetical protein
MASWKAVGEIVPAPDVSDAALVAYDDDLGSAFDRQSIFAAGGGSATRSGLRKDDLANAVAVADAIADVGQNAGHLSVFGGKDALARKKYLEEDGPKERGSSNTAQYGQQEDQRRYEDAEVVQQIAGSAEPAEEGRDGEAIDGGDAVAAMRGTVRGMAVRRVADMEAADVKVSEASYDRDEAEDKANAEADEIEGVHIIWCSVWQLFFEPAGG